MTNQMKQTAVLLTLFCLLFTVSAVGATPVGGETAVSEAVHFSESVNLPGWVGGLMAAIALALPAGLFIWMRQQK